MIKINDNFCELPASYLFSDVAKRINAFKTEHPDVEIIKMGIGDVTQPICPAGKCRCRPGRSRDLPRLWPGAGI